MTATQSSVPAAPAGLLDAVAARYGLVLDGSTTRLEGGHENDLFRVTDASRGYVVRVEAGTTDGSSVSWEHSLVRTLAQRLDEVVAPLEALDGTTFFAHEGRAVSVLPFVRAQPADRDRDWGAAASTLGRLHEVASTLELPPRPGMPSLYDRDWSLAPLRQGMPPALSTQQSLVERELARCWDWVSATPLPVGPIHGDYYRGNVLVADGRVAGLVDWREAHVDAWAYELANGLWEFSKDGDDLDWNRGARFVAAYREAGGVVPPAHDGHLEKLIRCRLVVELQRAVTRTDSAANGDWEYQLHQLRAVERLG